MAFIAQSTAVVALVVGGALLQVAVTIRLYEPPPPDDAPDADPTPLFESVLFAVVFGLFYAGAGAALGAVETLSPALGPVVVAAVSVAAVAVASAIATGRTGGAAAPATRGLGGAAAATVGAIGAAVLVL